jgi:hypothetical protein
LLWLLECSSSLATFVLVSILVHQLSCLMIEMQWNGVKDQN